MTKSLTFTINDTGAPDSSEPTASDTPVRHHASAFDLVASQAWAITPEMLQTICAIARREGAGPEALEAKPGRPLQNARKATMRGTTAIVPVTGPIMRYANLFSEISGATSLDMLARDFNAALDDPNVTSIVLNIDSPGGQAAGISEFAQMVRSSAKPVIAYIDGNGASAAYWIASAAQEIVVSKTSEVGSIGAVFSINAEKSGKTLDIVSSQSPKKRVDVTTKEGRSQLQARADKFAQVFIEDVAAYRGVSVDTVLADFGQGDMRMGAEAVAAGMADRVSTLEEVIAGLAGSKPKPTTQLLTKGTTMDLQELRAAHPDLCAALVEEGRINGLAAGADAERQRIQDVEAQALPGHEALITSLKFDGKTTGGEAAMQVLNAERATGKQRLDGIRSDAPAPLPHAAAPVDAPAAEDKTLPIEERAQAKWDAKPSLRSEFGKFETYLAYAKAQEGGSVRVHNPNKE